MADDLRHLCRNKGIRLIYTKNKHTILSNGLYKNTPILRVHRLFINCPLEICYAILTYCLNDGDLEKSIDRIRGYAKKILASSNTIIKSVDKDFSKAVANNSAIIKANEITKEGLTEQRILYINQKGLIDTDKISITNGIISPKTDDFMELDIVISFDA